MNLEPLDLSKSGEDLQAVLVGLAKEINALLPAESSSTQIHDIRVDVKKLRSLLKLAGSQVAPAIRNEAISLARMIKDGFGATRDEEVLRNALEELQLPISAVELGLPETPSAPGELAPALLTAAQGLEELIAALDLKELSRKKALQNWLRTYRVARKVGRKCRKDSDDILWHTWRKRIKDLFYQSTSLSGVPRLKSLLDPLEKLADLLGQNHDLAILHERLVQVLPDSEAETRLFRRKKELMRKALHLGEKCLKKKARRMRQKLL